MLLGVTQFHIALGQGTFNLSSAKGTKPRIMDEQFIPIGGSQYRVDVVVLNPATGNYQRPLKGVVEFQPVPIFTGANLGLFSGGMLTVPFIKPGQPATMVIRAWDLLTGPTYDLASRRGSTTINLPALGGIPDPGTGIPSLPADIIPSYTGMTLMTSPWKPLDAYQEIPADLIYLEGLPVLIWPRPGTVLFSPDTVSGQWTSSFTLLASTSPFELGRVATGTANINAGIPPGYPFDRINIDSTPPYAAPRAARGYHWDGRTFLVLDTAGQDRTFFRVFIHWRNHP